MFVRQNGVILDIGRSFKIVLKDHNIFVCFLGGSAEPFSEILRFKSPKEAEEAYSIISDGIGNGKTMVILDK